MGIGIHVPSANIHIAEGLVRVPETVGVTNPVNWAELSAIHRALTLFGPQSPVIHTDSQWCVGVLTGRWRNTKYRTLVKATRRLLRDHRAGVRWIPRELNLEADDLAKWASGYQPKPPNSR